MTNAAVQPNAKLTGQIINPVLAALIETFQASLNSRVERGEAMRLEPRGLKDVTVMLALSGHAKGVVCVGFPGPTSRSVVERFAGEESTILTSDALDALCDLLKQVGAAAKAKLNFGLNIGQPTLLEGSDHEIDYPQHATPLRVQFQSDMGSFVVDFGFVVREP